MEAIKGHMLVNIFFLIFSLVTAGAMFFDYKKGLQLRYKIVFLILIIAANLVLQIQDKAKEKSAQQRWSDSEWRADARTRGLVEAFKEGPEEKKKNLFEEANRETAHRFFDLNYSRLQDLFGANKQIHGHYLTIYYTEVNKIPDFYTWEEWRETEGLLFEYMRSSLQGYFTNRGRSDYGKTATAEFSKEREKYIKAKEREFNKGK